jgi:hypothetical protein
MPAILGIAMGDKLPTTFVSHVLSGPLAFGETTGKQGLTSPIATIDKSGYISLPNATFIVGEGPDDQHPLSVWDLNQGNATYTFYAVGDPNDSNQFPPRGLYCDEHPKNIPDPLLLPCTETSLATISVDVFNAQLYGGGSEWEAQRKPFIYDAIANRPSDVQCILELNDKADRDTVIAKAQANFPYNVTLTSDLSTQPTEPADQKGNIPPPSTRAACAAPVDQGNYTAFLSCLENNCAAPTGPTGTLAFPGAAGAGDSTPSDCISKACTSTILPLYSGDVLAQNCSNCVVTNTVSLYPFSQVDTTCTTEVRAPMAFQGQTPSMILSRFPIVSSDTYVLPSTYWRRVVHRAVLQLQGGKTIDFYCAQLQSTGNASVLPYAGNYGNGAEQAEEYHQEQLWQIQKTLGYIHSKSGQNPAILAIDTHASQEYPPASQPNPGTILTSVSPDVYDTINTDTAFQHAVPSGWVPTQCLECPAPLNAYNGNTPPVQWLDVFVFNYPNGPPPATDVSIFANDNNAVDLGNGMKGPLSATFGWNVHVVRP